MTFKVPFQLKLVYDSMTILSKSGSYSCQPGGEAHKNTSTDSYHYKIIVLKPSQQLYNGRGASSNGLFVQGRP